jgi:maleamate amidohydrolase
MQGSLVIDPQRAALLLIDLQEEQRCDPRYAVEDFEAVLVNARKLLRAARAAPAMVVHAAYRRDFAAVPPRPLEPTTPDGRPTCSDKDSPLTAICPEVQPIDGEPVLFKNDASAFSDGRLECLLRGVPAEWLIVAGVWTEACVVATVRDAIAHGIRVLLVKDACGSGTKAMHQTAILNLANRLSGGAVARTDAVVRLLAGGEVQAWMAGAARPDSLQARECRAPLREAVTACRDCDR